MDLHDFKDVAENYDKSSVTYPGNIIWIVKKIAEVNGNI